MSVQTQIDRLTAAKAAIVAAIAAKGVSVPSSALLDALDAYIAAIETGADVSGVTAAAADVAAGKKFVGADGVLRDGDMPSVTQATPSISVSSGGLITASATQSAGKVAAGTKSATKQLTTQGAKTVTPTASEQVAVPAGVFTTGAVKVAGVATDSQTWAALLEAFRALTLDENYADPSVTLPSGATVKLHIDNWIIVCEANGNAFGGWTLANAVDNYALAVDVLLGAGSSSDTVVQGVTNAVGTTITISGLSFKKVKTVFVGPASGGLNSLLIYGMLLHDGGGISFITYSNSNIQVVNGGNSVNGKYTYANGTLTINAYYTFSGGGVLNYTIIGE